MITGMKLWATTAISFVVILQVHSQGYIVPDGVTYNGFIPGVGSIIQVIQNPNNGDVTDFVFKPQSGAFQFATALDDGVRVFLVLPNDHVSLQPILSQSYTELTYPNAYVFNVGISFYVGLYAGIGYPEDGPYTNPLFGWAELVNNNGAIELLDSALEYGGGGIIAGTQTIIPIPEPGTFALVALGSLLLGFRRWRN